MRKSSILTISFIVLVAVLAAGAAFYLLGPSHAEKTAAAPQAAPPIAATPAPVGTPTMIDPAILALPEPTPLSPGPVQAPALSYGHKVLAKKPLTVDCTKQQSMGLNATLDAGHLWVDARDGLRSVSFNDATATVTVCHGGKGAAAEIPGDLTGRVFDLGHASLRDFDGDGNDEFVAFDAKCAGPGCQGEWVFFRVTGDQIESLAQVAGERFEPLDTNPPLAKVVKACPVMKGQGVISSVAVVEFPKGQAPRLLPFQRIQKLPVPVIDAVPQLSPDDKQMPAVVANWDLQMLVNFAYSGAPLEKLNQQYQQIMATYQKTQPKPPPFQIGCDLPKLLKEISDSK